MNDYVFKVHCSNGFREFDSHTTTKIINMYETLEHWKQYKQEKALQAKIAKQFKLNKANPNQLKLEL